MAYQPRTRAPRNFRRRRKMPRHEEAKARAVGKKHRSRRSRLSDEEHVPTSEEVVNRTLSSLRVLGNQKFVLSSFHEHFSRWLANLSDILSEFESSPAISVDEQFVKERSQTLSNIGLQLDERRRQEVSREEAARSLSGNRMLLERIEEKYATKMKEIAEQKEHEINQLSRKIDELREDLDRISQMKTGIFRAISKKAKAQKEAEATCRLDSARKELKTAEQHFTAEQKRLQAEYERRKQPVIKQIRKLQKAVGDQEFDRSLEDRRAACKFLANAVNGLVQRKNQQVAEKEKEAD